MNIDGHPLFAPSDSAGREFRGFLKINNEEYFVEIHLAKDDRDSPQIYGDPGLQRLVRNCSLEEAKRRLARCPDINMFLSEFQSIVEESNVQYIRRIASDKFSSKRYSAVIAELNQIGYEKVGHMSEDLSSLRLVLGDSNNRKHEIHVSIPSNYPLMAPTVTVDIPSGDDTLAVPTTLDTLTDSYNYYRRVVETYSDYFDCMDELDDKTRVLDPDKPKRRDTWRRIALLNHCSLHIQVDPKHPRALLQSLRFFGNEKRVGKLWELWQKGSRGWSTDDTPYTNLKRILGQELFQKTGSSEKAQDTQSDIECGICYAYKLLHDKHSHQVPDAVCANDQCNRGFHPYCLYEWLRSNPTTTRSFNVLFGNCPYCNEKITAKAML